MAEQKTHDCDILIIGAGVTGYAAGMYGARFNLKTIIVGSEDGGTINLTDDVANYPGFIKLTGIELSKKLKDHALDYKDIEIIPGTINSLEKTDIGFTAKSDTDIFNSKTVILATGTKSKKLGVPGEDELFGNGVHTCALCDGPFYKDKTLAVIGGSDSAAKEALLLTRFAKKVYVIYRGDKIHPEPINYTKIERNKKIELIYNTNVTKMNGEKSLSSVTLDKPYNKNTDFKLDAVFLEIGHIPLSDLAKGIGAKLNKGGEVMINRHSETNVQGFFAAGDVVDTDFKQAITGVSEGVTASFHAYEYIENMSSAK
ncbi:MAG: FAD-dependent oxidoreductase [Nanoarchaeota archaeon]|nr:FAD-dependent oxidoreductase [Nanoarchaeota archaeon]